MGTGEKQDRGPRWDGLYNWQLSKNLENRYQFQACPRILDNNLMLYLTVHVNFHIKIFANTVSIRL